MKRSRTIVIGLESAELSLVERWSREGALPFLGSLLATCPLVSLRSPIHALQIGVWPSLLTGASPGRHGQYVLWNQIRSGTYKMRGEHTLRGSLLRYTEFLADRGITSALADIPASVRTPSLRGMQIVDWGTEYRFGKHETEPRDLTARIHREVGHYPIAPRRQSGDTQQEHLELAQLLGEGVRYKGALARWLLRQPGLDHVFCVFGEMHKGAHWFWKYMDRSHVDHEDSPPALRDALRRIYQGVDRELATIAAQLEPQDNLVVMSSDGMQANYRGDHLAEPFLDALGLLSRHGHVRRLEGVLRRGMTGEVRAGRPSAPQRAFEAVRARVRAFTNRHDIDWRRTRVFKLPTDRNTYLRVNLRGREPLGCVQPGAEYEALLDRLETELCALRNGSTGRPAVAKVFRLRKLFPGDRAEDLPDLAVEWAADSPIDSIESAAVGTLSLAIREQRSGNHRGEGFLLARGPAFAAGPGRLTGDILQIAPTLLHVHGVPLPTQFECEPLPILTARERYLRSA